MNTTWVKRKKTLKSLEGKTMKHTQVPFFSFHMLAEGEGDVDEPFVTMHGNVFQPFDVFQIPSH